MKVGIIGPDLAIEKMFAKLGHDVSILTNPMEEFPKNFNLIVFTGGSDVTPILYNEANTASSCDTRRDMQEMLFFHRFYHTPKLGICRGGQFLNVMSGGRMIQDYPGHAIAGTHDARDHLRDTTIKVTSTHHQVMRPNQHTGVTIITAAGEGVENITESVVYQNSKSLCFQPHPEYQEASRDKNQMIQFLDTAFRNYFGMIL